MPKTAVGMFKNPSFVDDVVREIEALGFPRKEVRTLEEPANFEVTGVMSFPRLDFGVDLSRELTRIGATKAEAQAYVQKLRRDGGRRDQWIQTAVARCGSREHGCGPR